jgi:uncharacterized protein (TIGR02217 family)
MSLIVFNDVVMSNQVLEAGIKGRQIRKNQRVRTANGFESINVGPQSRTMREYDVGIGPLRRAAWQQLEALHEVTEGGAYGFLLIDPKDSTATGGEGVVADLGGGTYQLYKRYTERVSGRYKDRKITRPKTASITVLVSGTPATATIDATTGTLTISGNPAANTVTWTGSFYVPVHFLNDQIDWELVAAGVDPEGRFLTGPMVTLQEIFE